MQASFLPTSDGGERLLVVHPARRAARGLVLFVAPLGEEANKCRRMAALGARGLAQIGFTVVQPELFGAGDSSGELADATGERWLRDLAEVLQWAQPQFPGPVWLWGLRSGALLAAAAAQNCSAAHLLLWQPMLRGAEFVRWQQRQRAVSASATAGAAPTPQEGAPLEVGGYAWPEALLREMAAWQLMPPPPESAPALTQARSLLWLETATGTSGQPATLLPGGAPVRAAFEAAGWQVQSVATAGPPFWRTVETEEAPALLAATLELMGAMPPQTP